MGTLLYERHDSSTLYFCFVCLFVWVCFSEAVRVVAASPTPQHALFDSGLGEMAGRHRAARRPNGVSKYEGIASFANPCSRCCQQHHGQRPHPFNPAPSRHPAGICGIQRLWFSTGNTIGAKSPSRATGRVCVHSCAPEQVTPRRQWVCVMTWKRDRRVRALSFEREASETPCF